MPQVVQIQRAPNPWEQGGQSVQDTADNMIKSLLAMGQMQSNNALHMATLNMQNQRLADANARDDKRWAEQQAAQDRAFAQQDKWKQQELALQRDALNRQYAAMNKPQLVQGTDAYGRPTFGWVSPGSTAPKMIDFTGGGQQGGASTIPGLDAATTAGMNEVLSPNWSPTSGGGQQDFGSMYDNGVRAGLLKPLSSMSGFGGGVNTPSPIAPIPTQAEVQLSPVTLDAPKPANPLYELGQRAGIFPQTPLVKPEAPQYSDNTQTPQQPAAQPQQPISNTLAPGTVVDGSGKMVQLPDNVPWGKQEKQYVNGVEYYGARTPNGVYFKVGGPVPLTPAEKKDQRTVEKMDNMDAAAKQSGQNVLGMIQQARNLVGQGNAYGVLPNTGMGSLLNWIPGTTGKDLETTLDTIKANIGFDKLQQMRANSPTGAALGSVSDFENKMLQSVIASLATSQSKEQFLTNLQRVEDTYNMIVHGPHYRGQQSAGTSAQLPPGFRLVN